jgi:hypothetical protein
MSPSAALQPSSAAHDYLGVAVTSTHNPTTRLVVRARPVASSVAAESTAVPITGSKPWKCLRVPRKFRQRLRVGSRSSGDERDKEAEAKCHDCFGLHFDECAPDGNRVRPDKKRQK